MRFPWLQVDADFISAHAGDLGAHLGITRREALGLALDLWTWALARARDDAPPDGMVTGTGPVPDRLLAGSVGWTGPAEQFTAALVAVGLAVRLDDGYRLTGFGRYKATWEKNRRRPGGKPDRNRTGAGEEPARKTQTQTQTQNVSPSETAAPAASLPEDDIPQAHPDDGHDDEEERPPLVLVPKAAGKPARKPSAGEALYARLEDRRQKACAEDGVPFVPSRWPVARQNRDLGPIARAETENPTEFERFRGAWLEFVSDPATRTLDVPYSLDWFWKCRSRYEGKALKAGAES